MVDCNGSSSDEHEHSGRKCKLSVFPAGHFGVAHEADIFLHREDFPGLSVGDVVQIFNPDSPVEASRKLHLRVGPCSIYPETQLSKPLNRETVYVEKSIAEIFQLHNFINVLVKQVSPARIGLDSVEVVFKEQYMGRSEMWRIKNKLVGTCVFLQKKIDLCQGNVRCQVSEMWGKGVSVSSGVVTEDTKVVFRSMTAMIYLFIQMSSEMWEFNNWDDTYFDLAVDGFLKDMFCRWSQVGSSHEVTIVLFSRCYYDSKDKKDFPVPMRDCLQVGSNGNMYEDYYHVVVQNERFDDWSPVLVELRKIFNDYDRSILHYHRQHVTGSIPEARISTAAEGSFLEVLNMSLNTFENHYLNRSLDRTGQQNIVITPGIGIFEVDRDLMLMTKQRILDSGVGSDLICLGEQPFHAVPLFKLTVNGDQLDEYSMPHWINLSFYKSDKKMLSSPLGFVSRIKLPSAVATIIPPEADAFTDSYHPRIDTDCILPRTCDIDEKALNFYDDYDSQVFELPSKKRERIQSSAGTLKGSMDSQASTPAKKPSDSDLKGKSFAGRPSISGVAGTLAHNESSSSLEGGCVEFIDDTLLTASHDCAIPLQSTDRNSDEEDGINLMGSIDTTFDHQAIKKYLLRPGRALLNPFDPSHTEIRMTSNRRRWTHIFPKSSSSAIHQREQDATSDALEVCILIHSDTYTFPKDVWSTCLHPQIIVRSNSQLQLQTVADDMSFSTELCASDSVPATSDTWSASNNQSEPKSWNVSLTTGVDWKSLTIPASLPVTTDYFPKRRSLLTDYVINEYELSVEEICQEIRKTPLSNEEVFKELIYQRLAQGFQLIMFPKGVEPNPLATRQSMITFWLSIGRIFHCVSMGQDSKIKVTRYRPRHVDSNPGFQYYYRLQVPDNNKYEMTWVNFQAEKLEHFNWNRIDFYVCTRGVEREFFLTDNLKYWRFKLFIVPTSYYLAATKAIVDGNLQYTDVYHANNKEQDPEHVEGFLRFIETCVNRLRRGSTFRKMDSSSSDLKKCYDRPRCYTTLPNVLTKVRHEAPLSSSTGPMLSPSMIPSGEASNSLESFGHDLSTEHSESVDDLEQFKLKTTSTLCEMIEAMKSKMGGLNFITGVSGFPTHTFISYEAVLWLVERVDGVGSLEKGVDIMSVMQQNNFIRHASGNKSVPFKIGFYLYFFVPPDNSQPSYKSDLEAFNSDWAEIEVLLCRNHRASSFKLPSLSEPPEFLSDCLLSNQERLGRAHRAAPLYKQMTLDVDQNMRSERKEWGHLKYQSVYDPRCAYAFTLQWCVATGAIITDLIHGWARRIQQSGSSLIPAPHHPFALPNTHSSDPVRGPIFVELNIECLMNGRSTLFQDFEENTWKLRMFLFREEIAFKFGFVNCITAQKEQVPPEPVDHEYIHCTGNMFLLIPTKPQIQTGVQGFRMQPCSSELDMTNDFAAKDPSDNAPVIRNSHSPCSNLEASSTYGSSENGFLWSWNFMTSKRWKQISNTGATGDIAFMDKMLLDFRAFCSNEGNRLKDFWDESWKRKTNQKQFLLGTQPQ